MPVPPELFVLTIFKDYRIEIRAKNYKKKKINKHYSWGFLIEYIPTRARMSH